LKCANDLVFNFLGSFQDGIVLDWPLADGCVSASNTSIAPVTMDGVIAGGRLMFVMRYDGVRFDATEMGALADGYRSALLAIVDHCISQSARVYTASDFGDTSLDQTDIEELLGTDVPAANI
jgi:non-ribosomal peptide synthase protein (TIGR01720 family)